MNQAQQTGNEVLGTGRRALSGISDFLKSNTLVSKVVFLIFSNYRVYSVITRWCQFFDLVV